MDKINVFSRLKWPGHSNSQRVFPVTVYPYLNLRDRLLQIWINQYTIMLIVLGLKVFFFRALLANSVDHAFRTTSLFCLVANRYSSSVLSAPHYAAEGLNNLVEVGVRKANAALNELVGMLLSGTEELLLFYVQLMIGTYVCLLTAAVDLGVDIATNSTEAIASWVNNTLTNATHALNEGLDDLLKVVNNAESFGESMIELFTGKDGKQTPLSRVNLTVEALQNISIPAGINTNLENLSQKTPDFDTLKNKTKSLISEAFDVAKKKIANNSTYIDSSASIKVPAIRTVDICPSDENLKRIFDSIAHDLSRATEGIFWAVIVVSLLILGPLSYIEWRRWKRAREMTQEVVKRQPQDAPGVFFVVDLFHNRVPYLTAGWGNRMFHVTDQSQRNVTHWAASYVLTPSSLFLLQIGVLGVLAVALQFILLHIASKGLHKAGEDILTIAASALALAKDIAKSWANNTNDYLSTTQNNMNHGTLGLVSNVTQSLNSTISEFYDDLDNELKRMFDGTLLQKPVRAVVKCVIGDKIESIEKGLTWVHKQANVTLPRVNESYLSVPQNKNSDVAPQLRNVAHSLVEGYRKSLLLELAFLCVFLGCFILQILVAILIIYLKFKGVLDSSSGFEEVEKKEKRQTPLDQFFLVPHLDRLYGSDFETTLSDQRDSSKEHTTDSDIIFPPPLRFKANQHLDQGTPVNPFQ